MTITGTEDDPLGNKNNYLVHSFARTIYSYSLANVPGTGITRYVMSKTSFE